MRDAETQPPIVVWGLILAGGGRMSKLKVRLFLCVSILGGCVPAGSNRTETQRLPLKAGSDVAAMGISWYVAERDDRSTLFVRLLDAQKKDTGFFVLDSNSKLTLQTASGSKDVLDLSVVKGGIVPLEKRYQELLVYAILSDPGLATRLQSRGITFVKPIAGETPYADCPPPGNPCTGAWGCPDGSACGYTCQAYVQCDRCLDCSTGDCYYYDCNCQGVRVITCDCSNCNMTGYLNGSCPGPGQPCPGDPSCPGGLGTAGPSGCCTNSCDNCVNDCAGTPCGHATRDCAGTCGGTATYDCAGVCGGGSSYDCAGVCGGSASYCDCYPNTCQCNPSYCY
jgi:hypothetical protein